MAAGKLSVSRCLLSPERAIRNAARKERKGENEETAGEYVEKNIVKEYCVLRITTGKRQ